MATGHLAARAVQLLVELGIADLLKDRALPADEIAHLTDTNPDSLYRLLRYAAGLCLLDEDPDGAFSLAPLGETLRKDSPDSAAPFIRLLGDSHGWNAVWQMDQTVRTGIPRYGPQTRLAFYQPPKSGSQAAEFNRAMVSLHHEDPPAVVDAYDFSGIARLMDVGGGLGNLLGRILEATPELDGVLFDLPHVVAEAQGWIDHAGLSTRCRVLPGSFFDAVPTGADAILLSHVLHDWPDDRALTILRNCRAALSACGRLLIVEQVVGLSNFNDHAGMIDLITMVTLGGRVRTVVEHTALLEEAGFRLARVIEIDSPASILEAVPV